MRNDRDANMNVLAKPTSSVEAQASKDNAKAANLRFTAYEDLGECCLKGWGIKGEDKNSNGY